MRIRLRIITSLALGAALAGTATATVGRIVVCHDEWTLSNSGFTITSNAGVFAVNVANWFTGGGTGSFRAWSTNFGLIQSDLADAMTGAGHTWTASATGTMDLATLQTYDGIFLAADPGNLDLNVLDAYVQAGGNVYIAGGTGEMVGGAEGEAAFWNGFLNNYGLGMTSPFNGITGHFAPDSHFLFNGVDTLYQDNGNTVVDLDGGDPYNQIIWTHTDGSGLVGIYAVPEPTTMAALAVATVGLLRRRRR